MVFSLFLASCLFVLLGGSRTITRSGLLCQKCINVEVVQKEEELHRGLQFRKSLDLDGGMLFIFQKSGPYAFWMKDTLIPLDIIWMDDARRIVHIEHNVSLHGRPLPQIPPSMRRCMS